jgi:hypothetical protein
MKIKSIHLSSLRVVEMLAFLKHIVPILKLHSALNAKLKGKVDGLSQTTEMLSKAQIQGSFEGETGALKQATSKLTESLKLFYKFVDAFSHSDNPTTKEQATLVLTAVKKEIPNLMKRGQKAKVGSVEGLNQLFTTNSRYGESLVALSAKPLWAKVMADYESYDGIYSNRNDIQASEEGGESAYKISKAAHVECKAVLDFLEDLYCVEEKPEYLEMITKINLEIDAVMAIVHTRKTLAEKAKVENAKMKTPTKNAK